MSIWRGNQCGHFWYARNGDNVADRDHDGGNAAAADGDVHAADDDYVKLDSRAAAFELCFLQSART